MTIEKIRNVDCLQSQTSEGAFLKDKLPTLREDNSNFVGSLFLISDQVLLFKVCRKIIRDLR